MVFVNCIFIYPCNIKIFQRLTQLLLKQMLRLFKIGSNYNMKYMEECKWQWGQDSQINNTLFIALKIFFISLFSHAILRNNFIFINVEEFHLNKKGK